MRIAAEVHHVLAKRTKFNLEEFKLTFEPKGKAKVKGPSPEQAAQVSKSRWQAMLNLVRKKKE